MNKKNIIILIAIMVVVLIVSIIGVLYYTTNLLDSLKSKKAVFFEYLEQNGEGLAKYDNFKMLDRMSKESYSVNGRISWLIESDMLEQEIPYLAAFSNMTIEVQEKVDSKNKKSQIDMSIKNTDGEIISTSLASKKDALSIKLNEIFDKYITIENRDLKALANKLGIDSSNIPDKLNLDSLSGEMPFTVQELKDMKQRYYKAVYDGVNQENIIKTRETISLDGKDVDANFYTLTMNEKDMRNVLIKVLETFKEDDILIDYIVSNFEASNAMVGIAQGEAISKESIKKQVDEMINDLKNSENTSEEKLEISVYESKGKTVKTTILMNGEGIVIERNKKAEELDLNLVVVDGTEELFRINSKTVKSKEGYKTTASTNIQGVKMDLEVNSNKDLTEQKMILKVNVPYVLSAQFVIEANMKFENVQIEDTTNNEIILNNASEQELQDLVLKLQEGVMKYYENNKDRLDALLAPFMATELQPAL